MSTTTKTARITMTYADANTRTYAITVTNPNIDGDYMKTQIAAFNTAAATGTSDVNKTFVSDTGQPVTMISEAEFVTKTEDVIYSA